MLLLAQPSLDEGAGASDLGAVEHPSQGREIAALSGPNPAGGDPGAAESWWIFLSLARAVLAPGVILVFQSAGSSTYHGKEYRWTSTAGAAQDGGCWGQQFSCVWMEPSLGKPLHGPAEGR